MATAYGVVFPAPAGKMKSSDTVAPSASTRFTNPCHGPTLLSKPTPTIRPWLSTVLRLTENVGMTWMSNDHSITAASVYLLAWEAMAPSI